MVRNIVNKVNSIQNQDERKKRITRKRGYPDVGANLVALKAEDLLEDDKFECHICKTTFCREQNLELHLRSHEYVMPRKKVGAQYSRDMAFICPVSDCIHHDPSRALSDITAIKKHYRRKHGEKKWKCSFCPKIYAVDADCKQHEKKRHRNAEHYHDCPGSSKGKEAYGSHLGVISMREDNLHPTTFNSNCEIIIPPSTFFNKSTPLTINEPSPHNPKFDLPMVNQPPFAAPTMVAVGLPNNNEPPMPYYPEFEAEQNYTNISTSVHNHKATQPVAVEQNYANIPAPVHGCEVMPSMQIKSSSTFLSEFELDLLASSSTIKFTDLLQYGMHGSSVDGATSRGTMLNADTVGSYQTVPQRTSLNNLEQQTDDLNNNTSLGLNSQGFIPPAFASNPSSACIYPIVPPGTNEHNPEHQWNDLTMNPLWLNSQGFVPPRQQGLSDEEFGPRQGMNEISFYNFMGKLGD